MKILLDASTLLSPKSGIGHFTNKISTALESNRKFDVSFFFSNDFTKKKKKLKKFKKI